MFKNWIKDIMNRDVDSIVLAFFGTGLAMCIIALVILMFTIILSDDGHAHEGGPNGVYHMTEPSGDIVKQWHCPAGYGVWGIDNDGDKMVDQCTGFFLTHDKFHLFPTKQKLYQNPATQKIEPGCTCLPAITKQGGDS